jgi:hypothetical protein
LKSIKKSLDYHPAICYGVADVYIFNARGCQAARFGRHHT